MSHSQTQHTTWSSLSLLKSYNNPYSPFPAPFFNLFNFEDCFLPHESSWSPLSSLDPKVSLTSRTSQRLRLKIFPHRQLQTTSTRSWIRIFHHARFILDPIHFIGLRPCRTHSSSHDPLNPSSTIITREQVLKALYDVIAGPVKAERVLTEAECPVWRFLKNKHKSHFQGIITGWGKIIQKIKRNADRQRGHACMIFATGLWAQQISTVYAFTKSKSMGVWYGYLR